MRSNFFGVTCTVVCLVIAFGGVAAWGQTCVSDCGCPPGQFCRAQEGGGGRCETGICTDDYRPVCGLNGKTYSNPCWAALERVGIAHEGECKEEPIRCGGIQGTPCPGELFCDLDPGLCGGADIAGTCRPVPDHCTEPYVPVCGCDGRTYGNDCKRLAARVPLDHPGECGGSFGGGDEHAHDCGCCHPTVVSGDGQVVWSNDPELATVSQVGTGRYRLTWDVEVSDDAFFVQPIAPYDDFPRSLLGWPARIGAGAVEVTTDADYVDGGSGSHTHRRALDVRFSLLRCPRAVEM